MGDARTVVNEQAEDPGLWFAAQTAPEAYLQAALRRLHAAVEAGATAAPPAPREEGGLPDEVREQAQAKARADLFRERFVARGRTSEQIAADAAAEVAYSAGRADERARIVADLRQSASARDQVVARELDLRPVARTLLDRAEWIERGEHLGR